MTEHMLPRGGQISQAVPALSASSKNNLVAFPLGAGLLLGLGLGGFFDGIVSHQILQWHYMLSSAGCPTDNVENLKLNTPASGLFHAAAYVFVFWGVIRLLAASRQPHFRWTSAFLAASMLMGFGLLNMVEGVVNHHNETVLREQWIYWDIVFFLLSLAMLVSGWLLMRRQHGISQNMLAIGAQPSAFGHGVDLSSESVAGEEDPGASLDMQTGAGSSGISPDQIPVSRPPTTLNPGDETPAGSSGTGEGICRECGGSGRMGEAVCPSCAGSGKVTVGVGGA